MLFQVINESGIGVMRCEDFSCVPTYDELKDMYSAGYRFKYDGKTATLKRMKEVIDENGKQET